MKLMKVVAIVIIIVLASSGAYFISKNLESASNDPTVILPSSLHLDPYGNFSEEFNVSSSANLTFQTEITKYSYPITSTGPYDFIIANGNKTKAIENYESEIPGNPRSFVLKAQNLSLVSSFVQAGHIWYLTYFNPIRLQSGEYKIIIINLSNSTENLTLRIQLHINTSHQNSEKKPSSDLNPGIYSDLSACNFPFSHNSGENGRNIIGVAFVYSLSGNGHIGAGNYMFVLVNPALKNILLFPEMVIPY